MRVFGECAIVNKSSHVKFRKKINNKGEKAMFIGYSTSHPEGTYKFIKYNNQKIVLSRDFKCLDTTGSLDKVEDFNSDIEIVDTGTGINEVELNENVPNEYIPSKSEKSKVNGRNEISTLNITRSRTRNEYKRGLISFITCLVTSDTVLNNQYTPSEFKNEWNHHQCSSKIKWIEAIKKEVDNMNRRSVWSIIDKKDLPENKKTLGLKWVFKIK